MQAHDQNYKIPLAILYGLGRDFMQEHEHKSRKPLSKLCRGKKAGITTQEFAQFLQMSDTSR